MRIGAPRPFSSSSEDLLDFLAAALAYGVARVTSRTPVIVGSAPRPPEPFIRRIGWSFGTRCSAPTRLSIEACFLTPLMPPADHTSDLLSILACPLPDP